MKKLFLATLVACTSLFSKAQTGITTHSDVRGKTISGEWKKGSVISKNGDV